MSTNTVPDVPRVKPGEWVHVGKPGTDAVVCSVHTGSPIGDIEVVYLDDRNRAINEEAVWRDGGWQFKHSGPSGGYADNYARLHQWVSILRQGPK